MKEWTREDSFFRLETPWVTFFGEHYLDHTGARLEYYRVAKADSVIVVPLQGERLFFPKNQYRPGADRATLDFPGGRVDESLGVEASAARILKKELAVEAVPASETHSGARGPGVSASGNPLPGNHAREAHGPEAATAIAGKAVVELLSPRGYLINSSFSNQRQFNALARIPEDMQIPGEYVGSIYSLREGEIDLLLEELECGQCRLALFEFLRLCGSS